jgi:hypothetical protein
VRGNLARTVRRGATRKRTQPGYLAAWPTRQTTGHAHQFVCDLFGNLMHISDPLPGSTHDAKAIHATGLSELLGDDNAIGDKGYIGTGILTPYRKPAGGELLDWQKEFNTTVNKIRYVIEL